MSATSRRKTVFLILSALLALATLAGCVGVDNEILVRRDGSGQLVQTMSLPDLGSMFKSAGFEGGEEIIAQQRQEVLRHARSVADELVAGIPGGEVETVELVEGPPARIRTVISFPDVNAVNLAALVGAAPPADLDNEANPLAITCRDGRLEIRNNTARGFDAEAAESLFTDEQKKNLQMYVKMMDESPIRMSVRVEGRITETNARHLNQDRTALLLVSVPLKGFVEAVLGRSADLRKALAIGDAPRRAEALELLVPGLKLDPTEEITVLFE